MAHTAASGTLVANTVTPVSVGDDVTGVLITRHTGSAPIYVTFDGTTPTVAGANCYPVDGVRYFPLTYADAVTVKLICSAAVDYTVEANPA